MNNMKKRLPAALIALVLMSSLLAGCGQMGSAETAKVDIKDEADSVALSYIDSVDIQDVNIAEEAAALNSVPALGTNLMPVASGKLVQSNSKAAIDYSNTTDGYVMVKFIASSATKIKAQVKGPTTTYTYNLTAGASDWTTFPLSDGNGSYTVTVYENL